MFGGARTEKNIPNRVDLTGRLWARHAFCMRRRWRSDDVRRAKISYLRGRSQQGALRFPVRAEASTRRLSSTCLRAAGGWESEAPYTQVRMGVVRFMPPTGLRQLGSSATRTSGREHPSQAQLVVCRGSFAQQSRDYGREHTACCGVGFPTYSTYISRRISQAELRGYRFLRLGTRRGDLQE